MIEQNVRDQLPGTDGVTGAGEERAKHPGMTAVEG